MEKWERYVTTTTSIVLWNFAWKILSVHGSGSGSFMENSDRRGIVNVYPPRGGAASFRAASVTVGSCSRHSSKRRNGSTPARSIIPRRSFTFQRLYGSNIFTESGTVRQCGRARLLIVLSIKLIIKRGKSSLIEELRSKSKFAWTTRPLTVKC